MVNSMKQAQEMGYDRSVGMFSPDGIVFQVEYAEKAVRLGATVLALTTKEGIVFIGDRKIKTKLLIKDSFKKVFEVDNHIAIAGAGLMGDGRRLVEQAQMYAQEYRAQYESPIDLISLVKDIANIQQYYSQAGGLRPFGVSLLIGGIESSKPVLYQTTPSGIYMRFTAISIGNLSEKINEGLEKEYKGDLASKDAIKLGLKLFKDALGNDYDTERFDIATLDLKEKFTRLSTEEIKKLG